MPEKKIKKTGIVVYGTNHEGKRAFVMPYSEGRFGLHDKYYALPKGGRDDGEGLREAAVRETEEETGLDIAKLIGPFALHEFLTNTDVPIPKGGFESPGYPGVRIHHVGLTPVTHSYLSRGNVKRAVALFGIEVENIEALQPYLKNQPNTGTADFQVRKSITEFTNNAAKCPQYSDFMEWMETGEMPARAWNAGKPKPAPLYAAEPGARNPFQEMEHRMMGKKIETLAEWKRFVRDLPPQDHKRIQEYWVAIKKAVGSLGVTNGDSDIIKLDDKDTPLQFFQEGADIITAEDYLARCGKLLRENDDYALAFGGAAASEHVEGRTRLHITQSQVVAVVPFIPPRELHAALDQKMIEVKGNLKLPFKSSSMQALYDFHPVFTGDKSQPDYWTSRAIAQAQTRDTSVTESKSRFG